MHRPFVGLKLMLPCIPHGIRSKPSFSSLQLPLLRAHGGTPAPRRERKGGGGGEGKGSLLLARGRCRVSFECLSLFCSFLITARPVMSVLTPAALIDQLDVLLPSLLPSIHFVFYFPPPFPSFCSFFALSPVEMGTRTSVSWSQILYPLMISFLSQPLLNFTRRT